MPLFGGFFAETSCLLLDGSISTIFVFKSDIDDSAVAG